MSKQAKYAETGDRGRFKASGRIEFYIQKDDEVEMVVDENIFVDNSTILYRNLMFGEAQPIQFSFGDLNLTPADDWDNPPPANVSDSVMVNKLGDIPLDSQLKAMVGTNPAIQFTFVMPMNQYNGLNTVDGSTKIVEWGVSSTVDGTLFTKKNRRVIYKDEHTQITIKYTVSLDLV